MNKIASRDCFICGAIVPSDIVDYGIRHRYKCPNCGEYQITTAAKSIFDSDKGTLKQIVMNGPASNTAQKILTISEDSVGPENR
jgi:predicted RNA-binding Zn-ribbon protein involved in translation (DUF1610 family)